MNFHNSEIDISWQYRKSFGLTISMGFQFYFMPGDLFIQSSEIRADKNK